jgi:phage terminase large subunit
LGLWGKLENIIYSNWEVVREYPESYDEVIYGLDFGFNNPTALIEIRIKDKQLYLREIIYLTGLTNNQLIEKLKVENIKGSIYADSAEPARIEEIRQAGFNIYPAVKDVLDGIDFVKRYKLHIYNSENIVKEISQYSYKKDKNGNVLEEPIKYLDHTLDGIRYGIFTHLNKSIPFEFSIDPEPAFKFGARRW